MWTVVCTSWLEANSLSRKIQMSSEHNPLPALPTDKQLVLRVVPMPANANVNGDIFGGWVMAQIDIAGAVLPSRLARGRIVTVAVNQVVFEQPVHVGDLLSVYADVTRVGNTSITVAVEVYAQRLQHSEKVIKVTEAELTYVAIDAHGKPRRVHREPAGQEASNG
jgi:acyl-CoA thioesterase YciA